MPEGDTLFRTAAALRKALAGKTVSAFESAVDQVALRVEEAPLVGRTIPLVEARGKHLLIVFRTAESTAATVATPPAVALPLLSDDLVLHTHLRLIGSWHIYRPGEAWQKPARLARVVLRTAEFVTPCFNAPVVELLTARETAHSRGLAQLGPDAMTTEFDPQQAKARLRRRPDQEIAVAIMDQRAIAGVGNEFKSEILFLRRLSPFLKVGALPDADLEALIAECHRMLRLNEHRGARRTMFHLDPRQKGWVYGRAGHPCRVCGETIRLRRQGYDARTTYYCPRCQGADLPGMTE